MLFPFSSAFIQRLLVLLQHLLLDRLVVFVNWVSLDHLFAKRDLWCSLFSKAFHVGLQFILLFLYGRLLLVSCSRNFLEVALLIKILLHFLPIATYSTFLYPQLILIQTYSISQRLRGSVFGVKARLSQSAARRSVPEDLRFAVHTVAIDIWKWRLPCAKACAVGLEVL